MDNNLPLTRLPKASSIRIRLDRLERSDFDRAAYLSGLNLSAWVRQVLREATERRLAAAGERPGWI